MIHYEITTDPTFYGSEVTEDEARAGADRIADKLGELFPEDLFKIVSGAPREECLPGEEDRLAEIRQVVNDNWSDWI